MSRKRRTFSAEEKAAVALEAIREHSTAAEIARAHKIHNSQVVKWKEQALTNLPVVFERECCREDQSEKEASLFEEIGRLQTELRWLKKKSVSKGIL